MSNRITEKYFDQPNFADREKEVLDRIVAETGFVPEKEIFRGKIYDANKVGSLIYGGKYENNPAVLKIQGLKPEVDEIDIVNSFNAQNTSERVRLPRIYSGKKWNEQDEYGYLLQEQVGGTKIYQPPFASAAGMQDFVELYEEYRAECLHKPLFEKTPDEQNSLDFATRRVLKWSKIAESKGDLTDPKKEMLERFLAAAKDHLPSMSMDFMHGHLTYDDISKVSPDEYVLMSNLFWSYRPEYYDTTFHLWAGIKSVRDTSVTIDQIEKYLQEWVEKYKTVEAIKQDPDFERKFNMNLVERCMGAVLVDIPNQNYAENRQELVPHLTDLFGRLFDSSIQKIKK